ncbi:MULTISPECIES: asparagine synthase (glutamine-hydrolyzing) [unclassified Arenibacter]|uniref:asparagine synthase (glutamine-hydrolyzing) n=1 Tax=unclassified Arenibacter TaxID=2615047 RepID=UPI000E34B103|nr:MULTISPECIES: asparagine synthase (glutamine-hydrolyzing) [unclassified Arenibacter]MCM4163334.1 asparagine synthase (glutamine-hydrolyzing) [Arenibacter sp. A80]RFT57343.1 asparagine synthase (glutamine-hydrolyzing) [Arenibacter sp. P308M17]
MCGIIGFNFEAPAGSNYLSIADYRGPDNSSSHSYGSFSLGHNRLSIIDLTTEANQPFISACGNCVIVFNGEVYNYKEIRKNLESKYAFRTNSDTEVILYNYIEKKEKCLEDFIGMFAFTIYDIKNDTLFGARDRLGIKPLVYYHQGRQFAFASEIKVIKELVNGLTLNKEAIGQYLRYLYVPSPNSVYREVKKLEPAHYFFYQKGELKITKYWDPIDFIGSKTTTKEEKLLEELDDLLNNAVQLRMIADVELGSFLSGGIDSSAILYYMSKNSNKPINTFTLGFAGADKYDETSDAKKMATYFNTNHHEIIIHPNVADLLPKMVSHFDEPFGNPTAILIHELTRETKKYATVALAGDGGDEIFGGYPRYEAALLYNRIKFVPRIFWKVLNPFFKIISEDTSGNHKFRRIKTFVNSLTKPLNEMYEDWVGYFSVKEINELFMVQQDFHKIVSEVFKSIPTNDLLIKTSITDLKTFLVNNLLYYGDVMSMANSFEVRVPLIDHRIVEFMTSISSGYRIKNGQTKYLMKKLLSGKVPEAIINKPKLGLNPPMGMWLKDDLKGFVSTYLSKESVENRGLNYEFVSKLLKEHHSGKRDRSLYLWSLIVSEEWHRQNSI